MTHILLVDDNIFHREGVQRYLTGQGYTVHEAGDETRAWGLAQKTSFGAAVVDISLPPTQSPPFAPSIVLASASPVS